MPGRVPPTRERSQALILRARYVPLPQGYGPGVVVGLVVPKLTCERRFRCVSYEAGDDHTPPVLQSDWSAGWSPSSLPGAFDGPANDNDSSL